MAAAKNKRMAWLERKLPIYQKIWAGAKGPFPCAAFHEIRGYALVSDEVWGHDARFVVSTIF